MTALLLPFTHPNAFETIMYSLERDDGFVCSLACNRSSFWDHCDNAVIGRRAWSWNNWSANGLQQSTVASSVRFFMYDQLYRRSTRSTEVPLSPLHSPITCSYNIPILFESSGTNSRLESSIYSTLVVQTIVLTREREREPLNECHSNRQEILTCASWRYSVFGNSWNKKQAWIFERGECVCQTRLLAFHVAWVQFVGTAAVWMNFLRMNLVRTEHGTEARYLLKYLW